MSPILRNALLIAVGAATLMVISGCRVGARGSLPANRDPGLSTRAGTDVYVRATNAWAYAHYVQGDTLFLTGAYAEALSEFRLASSYDPGSPYLLTRMAECYAYLGDLKRAVRLARKAIASDETAPHPWILLGRLHAAAAARDESGEHRAADLAVTAFEKALHLDPELEEVYMLLAESHRMRGDLASTREIYARMAARFPGLYLPHVLLADLALEAKELDQALRFLEEASRMAPLEARVFDRLGDTLVAKRHLERAREAYRKALDLSHDATIRASITAKLHALDADGE